MNYDNLMRECFSLARKGRGKVLTNPMVGAIVYKDGEVIGRGYHKSFMMTMQKSIALRI